jgi:hypothetical protein
MLMLCACGAEAAPATPVTPATTQPQPTEEANPMKNDLTTKFVSAPGDALPAERTYSIKNSDIPEL